MKNRLLLILCLALTSLSGCATDPEEETCEGDVSNSGFSVQVELITAKSSNATYIITVCKNSDYKGSVLSVYGGDNTTELDEIYGASDSLLTSRAGDPPIVDSSKPGDSFEVTFPSDNSYFTIFEAELDGPTFVLGNEEEIIRGELIL